MQSRFDAGAFDALRELGLIVEEEYTQALAHPQVDDELSGYPAPAEALAWLEVRGLVSWQTLEGRYEQISRLFDSQRVLECQRILEQVKELRGRVRRRLNQCCLTVLREEGLISGERYDQAQTLSTVLVLFASPAHALSWLVEQECLSAEEDDALRDEGEEIGEQTQGEAQAQTRRVRILLEFCALREAADAEFLRQFKLRQRQRSRKSLLTWLVVVLAIGGVVLWMSRQESLPDCNDSSVRKTLQNMYFFARIRMAPQLLLMGQSEPAATPSVTKVEQLGYAKGIPARACRYTLSTDDKPMSHTMLIYRESEGENEGETSVRVSNPVLTAQRFSHLDKEGKFIDLSAPIGREHLLKALQRGVDALRQQAGIRHAWAYKSFGGRERAKRDEDEDKAFSDLEAVAPCVSLQGGGRYRCTLLLEHNDSLLRAMGLAARQSFQADFSFATGDAGIWEVTENFPEEYTKALATNRAELIRR